MTCTQERFERDVAKHEMTVIRDDGVNRHLMFREPGCSSYWFEIVTWAGTLCIKGDMGTYVFSRTPDMFEFFRTARDEGQGQLYINEDYWCEKLQAVSSNGYGQGSAKTFDADAFKRHVVSEFRDYCRDRSLEHADRKDMWYWLRCDVLDSVCDGDTDASSRLGSWFLAKDHPDLFSEWWEWDCEKYKHHYVWNLYAIAWAIRQYDAAKLPVQEAA
ncbi:hypothetical protein [Cupriavidus taiwanensis]|uniref:hypothetical protein n=1 Tax=Cupriavidus taiwanensis TaxID=164546 RepID=UPI000E10238F|nr:hypothetical protein [Cupriavidus taiwanensis]SOY56816.1 conserved hypothetical protein [Cupriavidus taiwanensis]SOY90718.1 conserved hypothetical protein [Cupriavidus taiwanensis]SOZ63523.1 conserved hypothetical protein [Cupriavidus taiwanensis]SOZ82540.1 conserved hypothetical protein [Cupriavidus taiwanensis]SOZ84408.1 conserved hypothetical protein [Cupriavidus taiwanensis]